MLVVHMTQSPTTELLLVQVLRMHKTRVHPSRINANTTMLILGVHQETLLHPIPFSETSPQQCLGTKVLGCWPEDHRIQSRQLHFDGGKMLQAHVLCNVGAH